MISARDRQDAVTLIDEARAAGARLTRACAELGIHRRTYRRWTARGTVKPDGRPEAQRPTPPNKLSDAERAEVLAACHEPAHASLPPSQIVPKLADQGRYIASEATFYRVLREAGEGHRRGRARAPHRRAKPSHCATGPGQLWSWDITWCAGPVRGLFYYLYLIIDIYSRKIVGWEVHDHESAALGAEVVRRAVLAEGLVDRPLVLHADNGSPQKGATLLATLEALGITPSYSRPRVSDDNPFAESVFRTFKYRPAYPVGGFADIGAAREWVRRFVQWYNHEHQHSGLRFVTPQQRHTGQDNAILTQRHQVYQAAKAQHPERWSGPTRNWNPIGEVWLNQPGEPTTANVRKAA